MLSEPVTGSRRGSGAGQAAGEERPWRRWFRFTLGAILLSVFAGVLMSGVTPPGVFGEVLRHNRAERIDASPLFYSDVENMDVLEDGLDALRQTAARNRNKDTIQNVHEAPVSNDEPIGRANDPRGL